MYNIIMKFNFWREFYWPELLATLFTSTGVFSLTTSSRLVKFFITNYTNIMSKQFLFIWNCFLRKWISIGFWKSRILFFFFLFLPSVTVRCNCAEFLVISFFRKGQSRNFFQGPFFYEHKCFEWNSKVSRKLFDWK